MADHQDAALELPQRARQGVHGLDVEVVGRFVQDEDVRVRQAQAGEGHAGLLAPGQQGHFLQAGGARDAEGAQVAAVLLVLFAGVVLGHEADGAGVHVQGVDVVLGEETDAEPGVLRYEADGGLELADEEFEDGGFAGAVGADDADARVELDVQVHVFKQGLFGRVAEGDATHLDDGWRELLHVGEPEVDGVLAFGGFKYGHLFKFLDPRLGFRRLGGVVAELVDECLQMSTLGHLVLILAFGRLAALFFGGVKGIEIGAFVVVKTLGVLVDDVGCYFVQESSVVGDDEEGAGIGLQVVGEESDGGNIQHVGRFCGVSASGLTAFKEMIYRQGEADLARKRGPWPVPASSSSLRRRSWWHSVAFLLRSPDLPVCLQHGTQPCPTPSQRALREYR